MIIKNAVFPGKEGLWDIKIKGDKIVEIAKNLTATAEKILDAEEGLVLPPFVEPHVHLDTTLTAGDPCWNMSGTLFEGIECWSRRKETLTKEDIKQRAKKTLKWQIAQGIQYVRTHVDVTDPGLIALKAMLELKEEMQEWLDLQIVAFPQEGINSYPGGLELLEESVKLGADVIGAIPHFEFTREDGVDSINKIFELALRYDRLIDVHCDEIDDEQSRFVEVVAANAHQYGIGEKVTASHTTAMHSYNNAYAYKLFRLLKLAKMNFVANPLVNIHLQGRFDSYPKRRGVTRVKELLEAGINICFGHDDIVDPWYPLGTGNLLEVLNMGLHICQLLGYEEIIKSLDLITYNSARTLNISAEYGVEEGKKANLIIISGKNSYDIIRRQLPVQYSIRNGKVIVDARPKEVYVNLEQRERVDFSF